MNRLLWSTNPEDVANQLVLEINRCLNIIAPVKKIQIRKQYASYISEGTKILMKERNMAKATFNISHTEEDKKSYNTIRNLVLKIQRKEKSDWVKRMLGEDGNNSKKIWQSVKTLSGDSKKKKHK